MTALIMIDADKAATKIYVDGIRHHVGQFFFDQCVNTVTKQMAQYGVFGWKPQIDNMLFEVVPMPEPWRGQWGYKWRCVHDFGDGQVQIFEFYLPQSEIASAHKGSLRDN